MNISGNIDEICSKLEEHRKAMRWPEAKHKPLDRELMNHYRDNMILISQQLESKLKDKYRG